MAINKEQLDSIMESAKQEFNGEIPDEVMEIINGGRELTEVEKNRLARETTIYSLGAGNRSLSACMRFNKAVSSYKKYVESLPEDSGNVMFRLSDWI